MPKKVDQSSPFKVNGLANKRAKYATSLLSSFEQDFTIHLGDVVDRRKFIQLINLPALKLKKY